MRETGTEAGHREIVFHDDEDTPLDFLIEIIHTVFNKPLEDTRRFVTEIAAEGQASCGTYPRDIAIPMLEEARQRIDESGYPLRITSRGARGDHVLFDNRCKLCGELGSRNSITVNGTRTPVCDECVGKIACNQADVTSTKRFSLAHEALASHFTGIASDRLVTTTRQFPGHMRADVQAVIDRLFTASALRFFGIHEEYRYETLSFATLTREGKGASAIVPAQYRDLDIGEDAPVKCLENGLWLCRTEDGLRYAVVLSSHREYRHESGTRIEIAVPAGAEGAEFVQGRFAELERAVNDARCYRGKVLSLDVDSDYGGRSRGVMVHKLPPVRREDVILPETTLNLLDRNVLDFVGSRPKLRELGQSTRKGLLLYGPPGTGKTHTIRYLAGHLPDHTTLIIAAEQVGALAQYMSLARLMHPSMVVIEDADLLARDRERMNSAGHEVMLNKLLNEMDGLRQDADILFVLTTNRPEQLESALASRPGRIDQAIEVPMPDAAGRKKLVQLYGRGLPLSDAVVEEAAQRSAGVSAAFIKELMRRIAQASIVRDGGRTVDSSDIGLALDDMLFTGGKLNVKLLGGAREMARA